MKKNQIFSILVAMFYAIAVFQLADKGFTVFSIICLSLGTIFMTLYVQSKKENKDGSN